ncbi:MAG: BON domain-containing protein [Calditrichia bacterium]
MDKKNGVRLVTVLLSLLTISFSVIPVFAGNGKNQLPDKTVKRVIEHSLEKDGILYNHNIQVTVKDSVITLLGVVKTLSEKEKAEQDAYKAEENYAVVNNIMVQPSGLSGKAIAQNVVDQIYKNMFYSIFDWVTIQVDSGVVTLRGWVYEPWHKTEFEDEAERAIGVLNVVNEIKVLPNSPLDDQIRFRAARLIYNDPSFIQYAYQINPPIHIVVDRGKVILEGFVDSQFDKNWAGNLVKFNTDAFSVDNQLKVPKLNTENIPEG